MRSAGDAEGWPRAKAAGDVELHGAALRGGFGIQETVERLRGGPAGVARGLNGQGKVRLGGIERRRRNSPIGLDGEIGWRALLFGLGLGRGGEKRWRQS